MKEFVGFKRGVDLGGWLSQCDNNDYSEKHFSEFITEKDFDVIAGWGLDHVRLPFDYNVIMTDSGEFIESGFRFLSFAVDECEKRGLNIVLDLHKTAGFVFDNDSCFEFFENERLQDMFVKLWLEMTRRFGERKNVVFELLNEVTDEAVAGKWNKIITRTVLEIRGLNGDIRIIVGGIFNNSIIGLTKLEKPCAENMVFTFHCYDPLLYTHQQAYWVPGMPGDFTQDYPAPESELYRRSLEIIGERGDNSLDPAIDRQLSPEYFERIFARAVKTAEENGVPLYCGEYGVIDRADPQSTVRWFKDIHAAFEKLGIARACWTYKEKDFGLIGAHYDSVRDEIVKLL